MGHEIEVAVRIGTLLILAAIGTIMNAYDWMKKFRNNLWQIKIGAIGTLLFFPFAYLIAGEYIIVPIQHVIASGLSKAILLEYIKYTVFVEVIWILPFEFATLVFIATRIQKKIRVSRDR